MFGWWLLRVRAGKTFARALASVGSPNQRFSVRTCAQSAGPFFIVRRPRARFSAAISEGTAHRTAPSIVSTFHTRSTGDGSYQWHRQVVLAGEGVRLSPAGGRGGRVRALQRNRWVRLQGPLRG